MTIERDDGDEPVGDTVCWLHQLCPDCGAMPSPGHPGRCWRCGRPAPDPGADPTEDVPAPGRV